MNRTIIIAAALCLALTASAAPQAGTAPTAKTDSAKQTDRPSDTKRQTIRVLYMGDSVTDGGWGRSGGSSAPAEQRNKSDLNHYLGHSYVYMCAAVLSAYKPEKPYEFINRGISGYTLADLERRWTTDVIGLKPDVLSVLIGINDILAYLDSGASKPFDWDGWQHRYKALLDSARSANPKLRIILGAPVMARAGRFATDSAYTAARRLVTECRNRVEQLAKDEGAAFVPYCDIIDDAIRRHPSVKPSHWIWDGVHPTPAGHSLMARAWVEASSL